MENLKIEGALLCPLQNTFFHLVDQSGYQQEDEKEDWKEDWKILRKEVPVDEGPWNEEDNLDIKQNEEHGRQVKLHIKTGHGSIFRREATLIGGILKSIARAALGKYVTGDQDGYTEENRQAQLHKDRNVIH